MKMTKIKILFLLLLTALTLLLCVACDNNSKDTDMKTCYSIKVSGKEECFIDEFIISNYSLTLYDINNEEINSLPLSNENINPNDLSLLQTVGEHEIEIIYDNMSTKFHILLKNHTFTNLIMNSKTVEYDGYPHSIYVDNLPNNAVVEYLNNNQILPGQYSIQAKINCEFYDEVSIEANLTIEKRTLNLVFPTQKFYANINDFDIKNINVSANNIVKNDKIDFSLSCATPITQQGKYQIDIKAINNDKYILPQIHSFEITIGEIYNLSITKVFGSGDKEDAALKYSLIEISNNGNSNIDLSSLSIFYSKSVTKKYKEYNLPQLTIPALKKVLIRCAENENYDDSFSIYDFDYYDISLPDLSIDNKEFRLALAPSNTKINSDDILENKTDIISFIVANQNNVNSNSHYINDLSKNKLIIAFKENTVGYYLVNLTKADRPLLQLSAPIGLNNSLAIKDTELTLEFSHESGFYDNSFNLIISATNDAEIFYTIDGSTPTHESLKYNNSLMINDLLFAKHNNYMRTDISVVNQVYVPDIIDKCITLNFIAIKNDIKSKVYSKIYFIGYNQKEEYNNISIITLTTDNDNLFDYNNGIYVKGKTFDDNNPNGNYYTDSANFKNTGKESERQAFLHVFNENKSFNFEQEIGIRIHGGWSRDFAQKSFNLYARSSYSGSNYFNNSILSDNKESSLMLRSGGFRDYSLTKIREALNQNLLLNSKITTLKSKPCILFLNGEYWGLYFLMEHYDQNFIEQKYGVKSDDVIIAKCDLIDDGLEDDAALYQSLLEFFKNNDLTVLENYKIAQQLIDLSNFTEYMIAEIFYGNIDWPANNFRLWRSRTVNTSNPYQDGKWRFMLYDTDDSLNIFENGDMCGYDCNPLIENNHWVGSPLTTNSTIGLIFSKLIQNENYKNYFTEYFTDFCDTYFCNDIVNMQIDNLSEQCSLQMTLFYDRFISNDNKCTSTYYNDKIQIIKDFFNNRYSYLKDFINNEL